MRLMVFKYSNKKGRQKNKGNCFDLKKNPHFTSKRNPLIRRRIPKILKKYTK